MTKPLNLLAAAFLMLLSAASAHAQFLPFGDGKSYLHPSNATSADNLKLALSRYCGGGFGSSQANLYRISMSQNNITVMLTNRSDFLQPTCFPSPLDEIDLGRLLPGNYTLTITEPAEVPPGTSPIRTVIANYAFIVADARTTKAAPYVRLDYSGHWWDPLDSGWGLFIWHDAKSPIDSLLAAWFTYAADGKPMWYVFQPTWQTPWATNNAPMTQTSRAPGTTSPPPNPTSLTTVGTASLDFSNRGLVDTGKITYTFTGGPTLTREIKRFKP